MKNQGAKATSIIIHDTSKAAQWPSTQGAIHERTKIAMRLLCVSSYREATETEGFVILNNTMLQFYITNTINTN